MATQNEQQNSANAQLIIQTDIPLWNFLVQGMKKAHKVSRVQAFCDLIDRQRIALLKGENETLTGTIQDMAKAWGWDRETVARFLDNLEQLGVITVETTGNRKSFMLKYSIGK